MGKWLDQFKEKNSPETATLRTAIGAIGHPPTNDGQALTIGTNDECNILGANYREQIRQRGFCLVRSVILGSEIIAVIEDSTWRILVPARYVVYTRRELRLITEGFRAGHILTIKDLMLLHSAKKYFKGAIIR
jgi:hypothetical protein